jgi:hypothetical protein
MKDKSKRSVLLKREARTIKPVKLVNKSHQIFCFSTTSTSTTTTTTTTLFCWFLFSKNGEKIFSVGSRWRAREEDR